MLHTRSHIDELQVWQEVEELESSVVFVPIVWLVFRSFNVGNPTIGIAVEVRTHVSEDNVWYM